MSHSVSLRWRSLSPSVMIYYSLHFLSGNSSFPGNMYTLPTLQSPKEQINTWTLSLILNDNNPGGHDHLFREDRLWLGGGCDRLSRKNSLWLIGNSHSHLCPGRMVYDWWVVFEIICPETKIYDCLVMIMITSIQEKHIYDQDGELWLSLSGGTLNNRDSGWWSSYSQFYKNRRLKCRIFYISLWSKNALLSKRLKISWQSGLLGKTE